MLQLGVYQHYKGGFYQVLGVAANSSNSLDAGDLAVVYVSLTGAHLPGPRMRVRPLREFLDIVEWPDGHRRERFFFVGIEIPEGATW